MHITHLTTDLYTLPHPYCHREGTIEKAVLDSKFCLVEEEGGFSLRHDHSYFYQVGEIFILLIA